jgi:hypothetical protein
MIALKTGMVGAGKVAPTTPHPAHLAPDQIPAFTGVGITVKWLTMRECSVIQKSL